MKNRNLLAALFLGTALASGVSAAHAAQTHPKAVAKTTAAIEACPPADFAPLLATHPVGMCWKYPGAKPAFKTREDAMAHRQEIFSKFKGWSPELVQAAIAATDKPPRQELIIRKNWFNDMAEDGGKVVRQNVLADFVELPERITIENGGIFLRAEYWEFIFQGKKYRISLPEICFNWADRVHEGPPPPPPPPPPAPPKESPCRQAVFKMNAGDFIMVGLASGEDIHDEAGCLAQQKPGEAYFEHDFGEEPNCLNTVCSLEPVARDGPHEPLVDFPKESFTAKANGYYVLRLPRGHFYVVACLHRADGYESWGQFIAPENFTNGKAFVVYRRDKVPANWSGRALEWHFQPK